MGHEELKEKVGKNHLAVSLARQAHLQSLAQSMVGGEAHFKTVPNGGGAHVMDQKLKKTPMATLRSSIEKERLDLQRLIPSLAPAEVPAPAPPQLPSQLGPWQAAITFDHGVPVGGNASLVLFRDGSYSFSGHFHDSGGVSYDVELVWVVVSGTGRAFTFSYRGHVSGQDFWTPGPVNANWAENGKNDQIAAHWEELTNAWTYRWSAGANWDVQSLLDGCLKTLQTVGAIVQVVVEVVAVIA